jgi:hypothetical protein
MEAEGKTTKRIGNYIAGPGAINIFDRNNITPELLEQKVNEYFESGANTKTYYVKKGSDYVKESAMLYTFTGLILYLGFISRACFFKWEDRTDRASQPYVEILKRARARIEQYYEELCQTSNPVGAIFIMKNLGYTDQQTINQMVTEIKSPEIVTPDKESGKEIRKLFIESKKAVV